MTTQTTTTPSGGALSSRGTRALAALFLLATVALTIITPVGLLFGPIAVAIAVLATPPERRNFVGVAAIGLWIGLALISVVPVA